MPMNPEKLFELFDKARTHLKYPSLTIPIGDEKLKIGLGTDPNVIWVSNGIPRGYSDNKLYGKFIRLASAKDQFVPYRNDIAETHIFDTLTQLCEDPIKLGILKGQEYKHCIFCNTELTSKASLFAGYGPICAENWGLPWGEVKDELLENL